MADDTGIVIVVAVVNRVKIAVLKTTLIWTEIGMIISDVSSTVISLVIILAINITLSRLTTLNTVNKIIYSYYVNPN